MAMKKRQSNRFKIRNFDCKRFQAVGLQASIMKMYLFIVRQKKIHDEPKMPQSSIFKEKQENFM